MSKYEYDELFVSCLHPKYFDPKDPGSLRAAVEHLRSIERVGFTTITVRVSVAAGKYKLRAPAALYLEQIEGKTPAEVWAMFDAQVDEQISYFVNRRDATTTPH